MRICCGLQITCTRCARECHECRQRWSCASQHAGFDFPFEMAFFTPELASFSNVDLSEFVVDSFGQSLSSYSDNTVYG